MLESVYPEVDGEAGEKEFRTMSSEEQMKAQEDLREQDHCLQIFEGLLSGRGVRHAHGLREAEISACSTREMQILKPFSKLT